MRHRMQFGSFDCEVMVEKYCGGGTALELAAWDDHETPSGDQVYKGEPIATATVRIPCCGLESDEVLIKDYSENEGMLNALIQAGYVTPTGRLVESGFVRLPVCKLHMPKEESNVSTVNDN